MLRSNGPARAGRPVSVRVRHIARAFAIVLVAAEFMSLAQAAGKGRTLYGPPGFEERVRRQLAIEEVYWRHRIWPAENPGPKPTLEEVLPETLIRERVATYLKKSAALELFWSRPLTGEQLQSELDRMVRDTKDPTLLRELFAALGDDPLVIAECLARPTLVDRLTRSWYTRDARFRGDLRGQPEAALAQDSSDEARVAGFGERPFGDWWTAEGRAAVEAHDLSSQLLPPLGGYELRAPLDIACTPDMWRSVGPSDAVTGRHLHTAVWTGAEMIVWGGMRGASCDAAMNTGGRYNPATDSWTGTSLGAGLPSPSAEHTAVWTGTTMIVWGGCGRDQDDQLQFGKQSGGEYNPTTDTWTATAAGIGVPETRYRHSAVWTGTEMIVWGGLRAGWVNNRWYTTYRETGGRYDPTTQVWTPTSRHAAPEARLDHTAVWTGEEMIVWGGFGDGIFDTGGRYSPTADRWTATSTGFGVPVERYEHTSVWTGEEMLIWGGRRVDQPLIGGRYDPVTDSWAEIPQEPDPPPWERWRHTAVWNGIEMIIWGGNSRENSGGRYNPATNSWESTSTAPGVPLGRHSHTAVWTGRTMIVWGGENHPDDLDSGGTYCACAGETVSIWYPDADGDGFGADTTAVPACEQPPGYVAIGGDCDDRYAGCTTDCTDADTDGTPACAPDCDDANPNCTTDCIDADTDTYCVDHDCDDANPDTHPGAEEVNDGLDNHCLYDDGYGVIDEITGVCGFPFLGDAHRFSWPAQAGATRYEVVRSPHERMNADCVTYETTMTHWFDTQLPPPEVGFHYLVRATQPRVGSWGADSQGVERAEVCP